jgi:hypothetical protein
VTTDFAPDYVDVAERLRLLFDKYPDASLRGSYELITVAEQTFICYTAECFRSENDAAPGIGTAWEQVPGKTPFTRGSEMQNAETSAWGRAIVAVGAAPSKHVASADEVRNRQPFVPAGFDSEEEAAARTKQVTEIARKAGIGDWVKRQAFTWPWSSVDCDRIVAHAEVSGLRPLPEEGEPVPTARKANGAGEPEYSSEPF